jgi:hypothetical protein
MTSTTVMPFALIASEMSVASRGPKLFVSSEPEA